MIQKIKGFLSNTKTKVALMVCSLSIMTMGVAFASEPTTPGYQTVIKAITDAITVQDIALMVGAVLAAGMVFVLFWMGARKGSKGLMGAITKGKIKI